MKNYTKTLAIASLLILASCNQGAGESKDSDSTKNDSSSNVKVETDGGTKSIEPTYNSGDAKPNNEVKVNADGSTIKVSKDGATVESKSGTNETKVEVSGDKTNITIKR